MKITGVQTKTYESLIPLPDLDSVKNAIRLFETGTTRASRETQRLGIGQVGDGMASILMTLVGGNDTSRFLERMFKEIDESVKSDYGFHGSYDYDGPGVFHKSSVRVNKTSDPAAPYTLGLNAAYVGDQIEVGLAQALGIERGLLRSEVQVELAPVGKRFELDLDVFYGRLRRVTGLLPSPEEMAETIIEGRSPYKTGPKYDPGVIELHHGGVSVKFAVDDYSVGEFYDYRTGEYGWSRKGAVITGKLRESYDRPGTYETPRVVVTVTPSTGDRHAPVFDQQGKQQVYKAAEFYAKTFRP